jgi:hypothetical protein
MAVWMRSRRTFMPDAQCARGGLDGALAAGLWRIVLVLALMRLVGGCAQAPAPDHPSDAPTRAAYGPYPQAYQEIVQRYVTTTLKGLADADYVGWRGPLQARSVVAGKALVGYAVCVWLTPLPRQGGAPGRTQHYFLINNGVVTRHLGGGDGDQALAQQGCAAL